MGGFWPRKTAVWCFEATKHCKVVHCLLCMLSSNNVTCIFQVPALDSAQRTPGQWLAYTFCFMAVFIWERFDEPLQSHYMHWSIAVVEINCYLLIAFYLILNCVVFTGTLPLWAPGCRLLDLQDRRDSWIGGKSSLFCEGRTSANSCKLLGSYEIVN